MQTWTNITQIEVVALKEASFLLLEKLRCPLINHVGDDIFAPINQPSTCAPQNFLSSGTATHVYKQLDQDFGPNQGMGGRFIVLTHSNKPFYKKKNGRSNKFLKPHY